MTSLSGLTEGLVRRVLCRARAAAGGFEPADLCLQAAGFFLQGQDAADADVLTLTIPVHEQAKPRSIQITGHEDRKKVTAG